MTTLIIILESLIVLSLFAGIVELILHDCNNKEYSPIHLNSAEINDNDPYRQYKDTPEIDYYFEDHYQIVDDATGLWLVDNFNGARKELDRNLYDKLGFLNHG